MTRTARIPINRGSAVTLGFTWPDGAGAALNLTGWAVDLSEVSPSLAGRVSIQIDDIPAGHVRIDVDAVPDLPDAPYNWFRPRLIPPAGATRALTLPRFELVPT